MTGGVVRLAMAYSTSTSGPIVTGTHNIDVALYRDAPITMENFLSYVAGKAYNGSFIHRSVPHFIIQGGGFSISGAGAAFNWSYIPQRMPIANEYSPARSNVAGQKY